MGNGKVKKSVGVTVTIEKFAKIEYASITVRDFMLFVGDNNSGKTLMMELVYAVIDKISRWETAYELADISDMGDEIYVQFSDKWFASVEKEINSYFKEKKDEFLVEYFSNVVPTKEIKVHFEEARECFYVGTIMAQGAFLDKQIVDGDRVAVASGLTGQREELEKELARQVLADILGLSSNGSQIFLPASRTGLQMLYRDFFACLGSSGRRLQDNTRSRSAERISLPVYDYLYFLQTFHPTVKMEEREGILDFIESELLGGRIEFQDEDFVYNENGQSIPLKNASSMIQELAPFYSVLRADENYRYVYYDEIENSIHPIKQECIARAIMRLCNLGTKVIVSTHSDTMAGVLNNLILVSKIPDISRKNSILEKLGWTMADMLSQDKTVGIYEFVNNNGLVNVEELEFMVHPGIGYEFSRFNENIERLYDESNKIMECDEDTEA